MESAYERAKLDFKAQHDRFNAKIADEIYQEFYK
jgi:hypothetical protein